MPQLFDTFTLKSVTLRNRIGVSPMCQYCAENGVANDWHLVHLGSRAVGGAGLVMTEATAVEPQGRISPGCLGLWTDEQIEPLARITGFIKANGAVPGIQLAHSGRKGSCSRPWEGDYSLNDEDGGWDTAAPSAVAFGRKLSRVPVEMTRDDMLRVREAFRSSTIRALEAGYVWLEMHAAHGYLIHNFLSPLSNKRSDEYGGSFENRTRFALEIFSEVREVWPDNLPLTVRISCSDWVDGGWTLEESVALSKLLKHGGADLIDCSSGNNSPDYHDYPIGAGWQVPFSREIREQAEIATAAVGYIQEPMQADQIVRNESADMVFLARRILRDPYWPYHAAQILNMTDRLPPPSQYLRWL
jgi:2,4-dienoyl-CoA reductase-like NADH-dependent reductase (Old Yellow Enzyme family)